MDLNEQLVKEMCFDNFEKPTPLQQRILKPMIQGMFIFCYFERILFPLPFSKNCILIVCVGFCGYDYSYNF